MARYKPQDHNSLLLPVVLSEQIIPGSFAFALSCPVDHELDLKPLRAWFKNDEMGASAYAPRVMSKIVLLLACANDGEIAAHFGYDRLILSTRFTKRLLRKWWTRKSGFFTASLDYLETSMRLAAMKALSLAALLFSTSNASAGIDFWNSNLSWAGQGQCSAEFTFDSGYQDIQKLEVHFNLVDKTGKVIAKDSIALGAFGQSSADRYQQTSVESEEICDNTLRVVVIQATATINGKRVDLIKTKGISARDFKPLVIRVPKP